MQQSQDGNPMDVNGPFGFVVIDKPAGLTSHACVSRLRRCFGLKRVGHGGTLDPAVTGVLPIALGQATRLLPYLPGDKTYRGVIQLGVSTTTDDLQGEVLRRQHWPALRADAIDAALNQFRGSILQIPRRCQPFTSLVNGPMPELEGEVMNIPAREITIHRLTPLHWDQASGQLQLEGTAPLAPTSAHSRAISASGWMRWLPGPAATHPGTWLL